MNVIRFVIGHTSHALLSFIVKSTVMDVKNPKFKHVSNCGMIKTRNYVNRCGKGMQNGLYLLIDIHHIRDQRIMLGRVNKIRTEI